MTEETRESSFDALAKGMASGTLSRGKALRLMGAALVGGTLTSLGIGGVAAAADLCKPTGKKCKKDNQCCSGKCEGGTCAPACTSNGATCASGSECCSGICNTTITGTCGPCRETNASCTSGSECCSGNCSSSSGTCQPAAGTGPNRERCFCNDGALIDTCASVDCLSGLAQDEVCGPLCATHGGLNGSGCFLNDAACSG